MIPAIKFSHNWNNKLGCSLFTTIRRGNHDKFNYYKSKVGYVFTVILNNKHIGRAVLKGLGEKRLKEIDPLVLCLDTGFLSKNEVSNLFKKFGVLPEDKVIILLFERMRQGS